MRLLLLAWVGGVRVSALVGPQRSRALRPLRRPPTALRLAPPTRATMSERRRQKQKQSATKRSLVTFARVVLPAALAAFVGVQYYDNLSLFIQENWLDANSIQFLSSDEIQFLPSFLTVISLLFSILAGSAYQSLYTQQESIYFALYAEVSEAKSLLEQMALVCAGRPFYSDALRAMKAYVKQDLRRLDVPPSELMARPPNEDPLEAIMYLTSVGVPSVVYETVRDLRQARGRRLGAMQRKFPQLGIALLYLLALLELAAFPLLGAGTTAGAPGSILVVQGALFGGLCGATTLVLRIIQELWRTSGGAFNVDDVLQTMVRGLADELDSRAERLGASMVSPDVGRGLSPEQQRAFEDPVEDEPKRRRWWFFRRR